MPTISELFDLSGKAALVTGGATGIGQAISRRLAEAGASVMVADINIEAANETAKEINRNECSAQSCHADASQAAHATQSVQDTIKEFGHIDILVNNAGVYPASPFMETTKALWDKVLNLNLGGPFLFSQAAAQAMIEAGNGGKIINMASVDGIRPTGYMAHYNSSKGGLIMLTKALALELAPHHILVNAIAPGGIVTAGTIQTGEEMTRITGKTLEEFATEMGGRMPLGRMGEPDEVARVVLFLASKASDYITGDTIVVDGGYLLC
ncbi:MAG: SDR family oxidoreductase [Dehalococcoidia bacterium]